MAAHFPRRLMAMVIVMAMVVAGCGDDDDSSDSGGDESSSTVDRPSGRGDADLPPIPLDERETIKVSVVGPFELYSQLYLAQAFGEFESENLEVEIEVVPSSDATTQLAAGNLDACLCSFNPGLFNSLATGLEARAVGSAWAQLQEGVGVYVRPDLAEGQPESLDGGKMSISAGYIQSAVVELSEWLEPAGMTINDIEPLNVAPPDSLLALRNGEVEAAYLIAPFSAQAEAEGLGVFVEDSAPPYNNLGAGLVLGASLHGDKLDAGKAFVRAMVRTTRLYLQGDYKADEEVAEALAEALGLSVDDLRATDVMTWDPDLTMEAWPDQIAAVQDVWRTLPDDVLAYPDDLEAEDVIDQDLLDEVLAGE